MVDTQTWEESVINKISEEEKVTYLGRNHPEGLSIFDQPGYRVYEFTPNKKLDGDRRYLVAGPEWSVMQQLSLLKTEHDILGDRLGYLFSFEEFWEIWEKGGLRFINRTGTPGLQTNYPSSDRTNPDDSVTPGWRKDSETRPGFQEWKNPNEKANPKARIIEYWQNRSQRDISYILMGSDRDIIQQILSMEWEGGGAANEINKGKPVGFRCKGQPLVTLYFLEDDEDVEPGWDPIDGEISFRIMDKTTDPDSPLPKLEKADLAKIAEKIHEIFVKPNNGKGYVWRKGKDSISYHDWPLGHRNWILCRSLADGKEVMEKVLAIRGYELKLHRLNYSQNQDPAIAYPTIPRTINVLGQEVREPRKRATADVRFKNAVAEVPNWKHPILIVSGGQVQLIL